MVGVVAGDGTMVVVVVEVFKLTVNRLNGGRHSVSKFVVEMVGVMMGGGGGGGGEGE